ncbi:hypothetical protein, partial [Oleiphilus sp. HI0123]|uniref:hypothetical protein n=1 Tax=Oleiphilus sp. HI0123 TaxID=1822265 RepID=UPI000AA9BBB3
MGVKKLVTAHSDRGSLILNRTGLEFYRKTGAESSGIFECLVLRAVLALKAVLGAEGSTPESLSAKKCYTPADNCSFFCWSGLSFIVGRAGLLLRTVGMSS